MITVDCFKQVKVTQKRQKLRIQNTFIYLNLKNNIGPKWNPCGIPNHDSTTLENEMSVIDANDRKFSRKRLIFILSNALFKTSDTAIWT